MFLAVSGAVPPGLSMIAKCTFGYFVRDLLERGGHQEADRDHELVAGLREPSEVRDVVRAGVRLQHRALDSELRLGLEQARRRTDG